MSYTRKLIQAEARQHGATEMLDRIRASLSEYLYVLQVGQDPTGRIGMDSEIARLLDAIYRTGVSVGYSQRPKPYAPSPTTDNPPLSFHDKAVDRLEG